MRRQSWKRGAALASVLVGAALLPGILAAPAQANHGGATLQATPEISSATAGSNTSITATLSAAPATATSVQISFGVKDTGYQDTDPPDATCTILGPATSCSASFTALAGSWDVIVWADENPAPGQVEQDRLEKRLSDQIRDCTPGDPSTNDGSCFSDPAGVGAGEIAELDATDVVRVTFNAPGTGNIVNCSQLADGTDGNRVKVQERTDASIFCKVTDGNGNPRGKDINIDAENISDTDDASLNGLGAHDPDNNGAGGPTSTPDYTPGTNAPGGATLQNGFVCTTNSDGTCLAPIPAEASNKGQLGKAILCFWYDGAGTSTTPPNNNNVYDPGGAVVDGGNCDTERVETPRTVAIPTDSNLTDRVQLEWVVPVPTFLDVTPDTATAAAGTTQSFTAKVTDQTGAAADLPTGQAVRGEFFSGSISDPDASTPGSPDISCRKNTDKTYTCEVSQTQVGSDRICFWFGAEPPMAGDATNGSCGSEQPTPDIAQAGQTNARVDVVLITWVLNPGQGPPSSGYWLVATDGGIFAYGDAGYFGSTGDLRLFRPVVGMAKAPSRGGYWLVASDGGIFAFADSKFFGSMGGKPLNRPIVGIAATPTGQGYWLVASDGGIFAFGDAGYFGSTGGMPLNKPIVGMAATPSGLGYWLVASDGGIFAFGDATFRGSAGGERLARPVVGMASRGTDKSYWLVASDGGIFAYGAPFYGSKGNERLNQPIVGMAANRFGNGYWLVASDGGIFNYGGAQFKGSAGAIKLNRPIVGMDGF